ncbi:hypothetical protein [Streptomyces sp. NPDC093149]|uniref:hypothetical protein n=1 Tax=Streptomyces sp. NPDC093149 TaxID=3366031 RepID=UPI0037FD7935
MAPSSRRPTTGEIAERSTLTSSIAPERMSLLRRGDPAPAECAAASLSDQRSGADLAWLTELR